MIKKLLFIASLLISIGGYSQQFTSDYRAYVKVKTTKKGKSKLKVKEILRDRDDLCLSNTLLIINSQTNIFIDLELQKETTDSKLFEGNDDGTLCSVTLFKHTDPLTLFINYGEWGVIYFLNKK
jgi:hypothetical protein